MEKVCVTELVQGQKASFRSGEDSPYRDRLEAMGKDFPGATIELVGVRVGPGIDGNPYRLSKETVLFYDVIVDGDPVPAWTWIDVCSVYGLRSVPVIDEYTTLEEFLKGRTLQEACAGKSGLDNWARRAGLVVKPVLREDDTCVVKEYA